VAKPFHLQELVLRVRARLRQPPQVTLGRIARAGGVTVDMKLLTADSGAGPVRLSPREFNLLVHLMSRSGQTCTRQELLESVWGFSFDPGTNVVDVCVGRLRAKLGTELIETVRNVGYGFQTA
jgi:DNA-binding response OmpR family regulator